MPTPLPPDPKISTPPGPAANSAANLASGPANGSAANAGTPAPEAPSGASRFIGPARRISLLVMVAFLAVCLVFLWLTRDAMEQLSFLKSGNHAGATQAILRPDGQKTIVDVSPWQTALTLAPLARTQEETDLALQAQRLADHEVDQAFASALRQATARMQGKKLTGEALELSKRVTELQQVVKDDQAQVKSLTPANPPAPTTSASGTSAPSTSTPDSDDLDIAKAQLGLDSDQLDDVQKDLARASGDDRAQIQDELAEREAAMKKYDAEPKAKGQRAVVASGNYSTLAARISAWQAQRTRARLIEQARQQALKDVATLTGEHNTLEAQANALAAGAAADLDHAAKLANLKQRSAERQLLGIYDDRIQTQQQLAVVYEKWGAQVTLQHRIMVHLILQSLAAIAIILICVLLADALLVHLMARGALNRPIQDRRRVQTLRTIFQLSLQVIGALLVLLVVFGSPSQMPTILGLATAGMTVVLQDFIIAFFGWFVLMGKHGIRVGDWVEINGTGGEVSEIGLFRTTLLETGNWTDKGHPTGRRTTFLNSFAIRGQYFNFSTAGQWMWDEMQVSLTPSEDPYALVERIHKAVIDETEQDVRAAEAEWKRGARQDGLSQFSATPTVNLRPSGGGIDILVRYVTRASERFEVRNRIYQRVVELLQKPATAESTPETNPA
jgi:small-conductance mechanosensitive channel